MIDFEQIDGVRIMKPEAGDMIYVRLRSGLSEEDREVAAKNVQEFFQGRGLKILFDGRGDIEAMSVIRPPKETTNG